MREGERGFKRKKEEEGGKRGRERKEHLTDLLSISHPNLLP